MKKKISIITLVMAMLLAVGGFTTSTAVSAKNKKLNVWEHTRLLHTAVVDHVLAVGEIELLQVAEQKLVELSQSIEEKLNSVAK